MVNPLGGKLDIDNPLTGSMGRETYESVPLTLAKLTGSA